MHYHSINQNDMYDSPNYVEQIHVLPKKKLQDCREFMQMALNTCVDIQGNLNQSRGRKKDFPEPPMYWISEQEFSKNAHDKLEEEHARKMAKDMFAKMKELHVCIVLHNITFSSTIGYIIS